MIISFVYANKYWEKERERQGRIGKERKENRGKGEE
jgi:hypothetical protein